MTRIRRNIGRRLGKRIQRKRRNTRRMRWTKMKAGTGDGRQGEERSGTEKDKEKQISEKGER